MYSFFPVHGKWGSPKDQPEIAGDLPEMACRPAVPTDACIRCNFDSDAPISRESLLEGRRRPENSVKFGGDTMTWLRIIRVLKQHTCGFDSYQPVTKICCHPETVGWFTGFPWIMIIHNIFGSTTPYYCEMP